MAQAAKAQEPSMEEILASIRRIIADDETRPSPRAAEPPKPAAPPPTPRLSPPPPPPAAPAKPLSSEISSLIAAAEPTPAPDVLELTEAMTAMSATAGFRTIDGQSDVVFTDGPLAQSQPGAESLPASGDRLLSEPAMAAIDSAFTSLTQTVLVQNARTLEDLVREMLRPMLKTWLDDNLPGLVERLVRAEIERVSRGRG
ncbi:MAG: DUF2497 domain-containing protein [Rhizobiales bacterium]|nr:DUF2497 domain-containing protein [Hyphomicrobiales bacterium]